MNFLLWDDKIDPREFCTKKSTPQGIGDYVEHDYADNLIISQSTSLQING